MTPTSIRERLEEAGDGVDPEEFVAALEYVRDDGRSRRLTPAGRHPSPASRSSAEHRRH